jgi:glyoxylase-like metal-dependent hydrolase (beta-lactamase superfamily II)
MSVVLPSPLLSPGYETVEVTDSVLAFISTEFRGVVVTGNSVAIAGDDVVLVVDSGHFPTVTRSQIDEIRRTFKKPVRFLVNTHWHPDHWIGNGIYKEEFPDILILSHAFTRMMIDRKLLNYPKQTQEQVNVMMKDLKQAIQDGKRLDGTVLTEEDKKYRVDVSIPDMETFLGEIDKMKVQPPTATFEQGLDIDLGNRLVRVMHLGRGNTAGDVVVHVPDSGIIMAGDLVVAPTPFSFGSYLRDWVETLKKLRSVGSEVLVPGHGPIMHDWKYVESLTSMLQSVSQQVRDVLEKNALAVGSKPLTVPELQAKVDLKRFQQKLAGDGYFLNLAFERAFTQPAIERAYLEEKFALE